MSVEWGAWDALGQRGDEWKNTDGWLAWMDGGHGWAWLRACARVGGHIAHELGWKDERPSAHQTKLRRIAHPRVLLAVSTTQLELRSSVSCTAM